MSKQQPESSTKYAPLTDAEVEKWKAWCISLFESILEARRAGRRVVARVIPDQYWMNLGAGDVGVPLNTTLYQVAI